MQSVTAEDRNNVGLTVYFLYGYRKSHLAPDSPHRPAIDGGVRESA